jgi:glutamine amidotransferase
VNVAIVDYGAGNVASVKRAIEVLGATASLARQPEELEAVDLVIVPGVGHFQLPAGRLDDGWRQAIHAHLKRRQPVLGICLGMQWLFEASDEAPGSTGLGLIAGRCTRLPEHVKVPHVGWNTLEDRTAGSRLLAGLSSTASVYFCHTYAAPLGPAVVATTSHGHRFAAAVERDSVFGVQFHPEKSGEAGLKILANVLSAARTGATDAR